MKSEILNIELNVKIIHRGLSCNDTNWQHDLWDIVINGQRFEYKTGTGHRKIKPDFKNGFFHGRRYSLDTIENCTMPVLPKIDDILYSLFSDSIAINSNFDDWCDDYGYDDDSRSALDTFNQCIDNTKKLMSALSINRDQLIELAEKFNDY